MSNLLTHIRNIELRFLQVFFFFLAFLVHFANYWEFGIFTIVLATAISTLRYQHDKKWLADAEKYVRIDTNFTFARKARSILLAAVISTLFYLFLNKYEDDITQITLITFFSSVLALSIGEYFSNFVASLKSFEEGIQLPGRNQAIIPWKEIYQFNLVNEKKITLSTSKGEYEFIIDKNDPEHVQAMMLDWQERNGRRKKSSSYRISNQ